jgi:type VI secretion system protein ImpC
MASPETLTEGGPAEAQFEASEFGTLLQKEFKPKTTVAKEAVASAVQTLAEHALANT